MRITKTLLTLVGVVLVSAVPLLMLPPARAAEPTAVTFQQVVDYLKLEVKEEKILKLLEASPAVFTLGEQQIAELREAGASPKLIAAMQKPAAKIGAESSDIQDFVFVLDCSGSMKDLAEPGVTKWEAAQRAAIQLIESVPSGRSLGFIVYGHDVTRRCGAVDQIRELSSLDDAGKAELIATIKELQPAADTPIAASLNMVGNVLRNSKNLAKVVVITDGMETCKGDPASEAAALAAMKHLQGGVDVIGFGLNRDEVAAVRKIAEAGRGEFFNAETVSKLQDSVKMVSKKIETSQPAAATRLSALDQLLIKKLKSKECSVRAEAAKQLGERKVAAAAQPLFDSLTEQSWVEFIYLGNVRWMTDPSKVLAYESLLIIDPDLAKKAILINVNGKNIELRAWSIEKAVELKLREAVPAMVAMIEADEWAEGINLRNLSYYTSDANHAFALENLKKLDPNAAQGALVKAAESENEHTQAWALKALTELDAELPK